MEGECGRIFESWRLLSGEFVIINWILIGLGFFGPADLRCAMVNGKSLSSQELGSHVQRRPPSVLLEGQGHAWSPRRNLCNIKPALGWGIISANEHLAEISGQATFLLK